MAKIKVLDSDITIVKDDYISLTDIANSKDGDARAADIIKNWIRNRGTLEFIGTWEQIHNENFKVVEFDHFKMSAGLASFVLSPGKWVENTNAIGIVVKSGRYGGTYAHKDIAFEFASAINPIFKLYLIKEFQRQIHFVYASEADILNVALFGMTAKQWQEENPKLSGNMRDYADVNQLVCLANLESLNAHFIDENISQNLRVEKLNKVAIKQMNILLKDKSMKILGE
jgi:hypothetical protein